MRTFQFYGISIDTVRDIFGASPEFASRLRAIAATALPARKPSEHGLLAKLGPLFTRSRSTEITAGQPRTTDIDVLLAGGHVPPQRLQASWKILLVWLNELSRVATTVNVTDFDQVEFDLARIGLSSNFSLRSLAERELGIPLRPIPGQRVGYSRGLHASETLSAVRDVLAHRRDDVAPPSEATSRIVDALLELLEPVASAGGALDVVCISVDEI